ncbi:four helix bundle protein [Patescibacteria group bacterium]|nr:four helix bundle protein [Patescibacteria group bacterium]MBU4512527.1 four helix bundle protein [Patescibacteria group bacterium]MCG2693494.1 four helix bundle protein [Candidatus Parcubacteria bacterium]
MAKEVKKIGDLTAYVVADELADYVWDIVIKWDWFAKKTVGDQFVRAIDSIGSNIAEGFGRFHFSDKVKFFHYSRASVFESQFWTKKSLKRKLLIDEQYNHIIGELRKLPKEINILIKINKDSKKNY